MRAERVSIWSVSHRWQGAGSQTLDLKGDRLRATHKIWAFGVIYVNDWRPRCVCRRLCSQGLLSLVCSQCPQKLPGVKRRWQRATLSPTSHLTPPARPHRKCCSSCGKVWVCEWVCVSGTQTLVCMHACMYVWGCICICEWIYKRMKISMLYVLCCGSSGMSRLCDPIDCIRKPFYPWWFSGKSCWSALPCPPQKSSRPRDWTYVFVYSCIVRQLFYY